MTYDRWSGTNRYVCDVLKEMRKLTETNNYSSLPSLIEEVQICVNRMEAGLEDKGDLRELAEERTKVKKEISKLRKKRDKLKKKAKK